MQLWSRSLMGTMLLTVGLFALGCGNVPPASDNATPIATASNASAASPAASNAASPSASGAVTITTVFGVRRIPGIDESGFYDTESDSHGGHWRWTTAHATLEVPRPENFTPHTLVLVLAVPRPTRLDVHIDGKTVLQETLKPGDDTLSIPYPTEKTAAKNKIDLLSSTFVPQQIDPKSGDKRSLGVCVVKMQLTP